MANLMKVGETPVSLNVTDFTLTWSTELSKLFWVSQPNIWSWYEAYNISRLDQLHLGLQKSCKWQGANIELCYLIKFSGLHMLSSILVSSILSLTTPLEIINRVMKPITFLSASKDTRSKSNNIIISANIEWWATYDNKIMLNIFPPMSTFCYPSNGS